MAPSASFSIEAPSWSDLEAPLSRQLVGTTQFETFSDVKNILITGGAGFIGSWVTRHMSVMYKTKYNIVCLDKMDTVASESNISSLQTLPNFRFVKGDITDMRDVVWTLKTYRIDAVMHFAASSHVQSSFSDPFAFTHNNVIGTHILLEAVRAYGKIKRFLHVSTDEVYGESHGVFADETHQLGPTNPYSASKAAAEMYVNAYHKSFGIPVVTVRSNNVYGPCQYPEKIIPTFIKLIMGGQKLTIQGTGKNTRRYLYGADAADAFDTIFHRGQVGEVYNIDSAYEVENIAIAKCILEHFGLCNGTTGEETWAESIRYIPDRPFNDGEYRVDGSKLEALGWSQKVSFEKGLKTTVEWYRQNMGKWWTRSMTCYSPGCGSLALGNAAGTVVSEAREANGFGSDDSVMREQQQEISVLA